jgi:spectinomycin phosphotransferase
MLEKPDIPDQLILSHVQDEYGVHATQVTFLPLGADVNTSVYRLVTADGTAYFLKLRKGVFDEIAGLLPQFLKAQGIRAIIAPIETRSRTLWGSLEDFKMILYPFIEGRNGYEVKLSDQNWHDLGATLKRVHAAHVPPLLSRLIPREVYSSHWRESVRAFLTQIEQTTYDDPVAAKLAVFMKANRDKISHMVGRAEQLGHTLRSRTMEFVLCHSDVHPGNFLIGSDGVLSLVDWDNPIFAPKERDLMFPGAGMGGDEPDRREEALFYQGYGKAEVDQMALVYYRYERILTDIAEFCQQLLLTAEGGEDREQSYKYFTGQFLPGHVVDIAGKSDALMENG